MHKVGVIGSGVVGQTLARGFKTHGHDVRIASRTPAKLAEFSSSAGIPAATFAEAAAWADLIVLAVHGAGAEEALGLAGADNLRGKIVIDTTNPISDQAPVDGVLQFFTIREGLQQRRQCADGEPAVSPGQTDDVPLRQRCGGEGVGVGNSEAVRVGTRRHGDRGRRSRDRAAVPALVHSGIAPE